METITLGGGCFWCLEAVYDELLGVQSVESGYMGGHVLNPNYKEVCSATTGHAEVVRVTFDPAVVSTREILEVFFTIHDPTTLNAQGNDVGPQYRSAIFYHTESQRETAIAVIQEMAPAFEDPIVTEVTPAAEFFIAEDYHQ
jgi:peptide-methionine (S)-S-oxide reductase